MRHAIALLALLVLSVPAHAQFGTVFVYGEFVVDPNIGGGGYYELTIANESPEDVYIVMIGNYSSEVIYSAPGMSTDWSARRGDRRDWELGSLLGDYAHYETPQTELLSWDTYVGAYSQVLAWQSKTAGTSIGPGETLVGFRFLGGIGARTLGEPIDPVPFVAFGGSGEIVASGMTIVNNPVPVAGTNFSRIKSLFSR